MRSIELQTVLQGIPGAAVARFGRDLIVELAEGAVLERLAPRELLYSRPFPSFFSPTVRTPSCGRGTRSPTWRATASPCCARGSPTSITRPASASASCAPSRRRSRLPAPSAWSASASASRSPAAA